MQVYESSLLDEVILEGRSCTHVQSLYQETLSKAGAR
jgi:hypothetical protein